MSYTFTQTGSEIQAILDRAEAGGQIDQDIAAKQDALTFDDAPTSGSDNPVKSGGIYDAIQAGGATALAAFATDSVSGDIVSFSDGADGIPVKSFSGTIVPQQSGSGDPSPSNVRPISGWSVANITRAGKNILPNVMASASGTSINLGTTDTTTGYSVPMKAGTYAFTGKATKSCAWNVRAEYATSVTAIGTGADVTGTFTLTQDANVRIWAYNSGGLTTANITQFQVELGGTATAYEAYQGETILLTFGETVYAGTITALGGGRWQIQPTHAIYTVTGAEADWGDGAAPDVQLNSNVLAGRITGGARIVGSCSMSPTNSSGNLDTSVIRANSSTGYFLICKGVIGATTWGQSFADLASWKSWLATQYANGTPLQVCYELAEASRPDPIIASGDDLATLLGSNTVWLSCGAVTELEYRADTALYIQKLLNGGTLSTLSMAAPSPSLSLGRVDVLAEQEAAEPEADAEPEQSEGAEEQPEEQAEEE